MRCSCELTYWSTNEIKEKRRIAIKEFNNEVLNLVLIQNKLDKNNIIGEQQHIEIDKLDFKILEFDKAIKNLKILLEKKQCWVKFCWRRNRVNRGNKRKNNRIASRIRIQKRFKHAGWIWNFWNIFKSVW